MLLLAAASRFEAVRDDRDRGDVVAHEQVLWALTLAVGGLTVWFLGLVTALVLGAAAVTTTGLVLYIQDRRGQEVRR